MNSKLNKTTEQKHEAALRIQGEKEVQEGVRAEIGRRFKTLEEEMRNGLSQQQTSTQVRK